MKKFVSVVLILAMVFSMSLFAGCGGSDSGDQGSAEKTVIDLTVGSGHSETGMPYTKAGNDYFVKEVAERVAAETDYEINWTTAYSGSIAKLAEVLGAVKDGLLDVGFICSAFQPANMIVQNLTYNVPFNSPDLVLVDKIMGQIAEEFPEDFDKVFDDNNQICLGIGGVGSYQLITTDPIDEISDLKNYKVAAAGPNIPMLDGTGAVPIQGDLTEAYTSFQTGVYNGWVMYTASSNGYKLYEVAPYQTNLDLGAVSCGYISINKDTWESLPEEVQKIMTEVGQEFTDHVAGEVANEMDETGLEEMTKNGLEIVELKAGEKEKYAELMPNMCKDWAEECDEAGYKGTEMMKRYLELLEENGVELQRDWAAEFK